MKTTKFAHVLLVGSLLLAATGCGKSKALMASEEYEKAACACKTPACATEASKKYTESAKDMMTAKASEADAISKAATAAADCVVKASMAGMPGTPGK